MFNLFNNDRPRCDTRNTLRVEGVGVLSDDLVLMMDLGNS